jgi:Predicted glycosyltransferases
LDKKGRIAMISVVIPMYNSKDTIFDSIDSIINQSRYDLIREIIVVDDGSTDGSSQFVSEHYAENKKIKVIRKKNGGVSSARNAGVQSALSEWIAFLDSDDIWLEEKIRVQWEAVTAHPEIMFIGSNRNKENIHWGRKYDDNRKIYSIDLTHLLIKNWPSPSSVLIKKELLNITGLYDESMQYAEEGDLWNRIAILNELYYIADIYIITGSQKISFGESGLSANLKKMYQGNIRNIKLLKEKNKISFKLYIFLRIFYGIKQIRRIVITKWITKFRKKK